MLIAVWLGGPTLASAIEQVIVCMFNYMTDLDGVDIDRSCNREITATGKPRLILAYNFVC